MCFMFIHCKCWSLNTGTYKTSQWFSLRASRLQYWILRRPAVQTPNHVYHLLSLHSGAPPTHGPVQTSSSTGSGQRAHPSHRHTPTAADSQELPPVPVTPHTHTLTKKLRPICFYGNQPSDCTSIMDGDNDADYMLVLKTELEESLCVYNCWG